MTHVPTPRRPLRLLGAPVLAALVLVLTTGAGAASAKSVRTASAKSVSSANAYVTHGVCTTSIADPQARSATFNVGLREFTRKATSYGFRAQIQERAPRGRWTTLTGAQSPDGLGVWQDAQVGSSKMVRKITVRGLRPGSSYRLRVGFRWLGPGVKKTSVTRTSGACEVLDLRPNLAITGAIGWVPGTTGDQVVYRVPVATSGLAALRATDVVVEVRQGTALLGRSTFRPTSSFAVELVPGRRCVSGQPITVILDPDGLIDEQNEQDNAVAAPCQPVT